MMGLVDAHNHLQDLLLAPHLERVLADQGRDGVVAQVVNGTSEADWASVRDLCDRIPGALPAFGLHPWFVGSETGNWRERLSEFLNYGGCSVGEIGLDRWKRTDNFAAQIEAFRWQWEMASERNLAVTVHCLRAWDVLEREVDRLPRLKQGFLLHAYGGPTDRVRSWVDRGAYFSFSPTFGLPGRDRKLAPFRVIPSDRLLVESDAPSMALPESAAIRDLPRGPHGEPINHPSNLTVGYRMLSELRSPEPTEISSNFSRLFGASAK